MAKRKKGKGRKSKTRRPKAPKVVDYEAMTVEELEEEFAKRELVFPTTEEEEQRRQDAIEALRQADVAVDEPDAEDVADEAEEQRQDREDRSITVRAIRVGEYPSGHLREVGEVFGYVQPEDEPEALLPSWVEAVDDDVETKAEPRFQEPGTPVDHSFTADDAKAGRRPNVRVDEDDE